MSCERDSIFEAIELSLQEWAVDRRIDSSFRKKVIQRALKYSREKERHPLNISELEDTHLSRDPRKAIHHVLTMALQETCALDIARLTTTQDKLGLFSAPFSGDRNPSNR